MTFNGKWPLMEDEYACDLSEKCLIYDWAELHLKNACDKFGIKPEIKLKYGWDLPEICLWYVWD